MPIDETDARLLAAIADGLPLTPRPYAAVGERLRLSESRVLSRLRRLISDQVIVRFGVIVRHRELGYKANAMVAWNVPDDRVAGLGRKIASHPFVTLCYERRRCPPDWPYNIYCMIHGTEEQAVLEQIDALSGDEGLSDLDRVTLFSRHRFKQRGARYALETKPLKGAA
ncbi:MAG TPA: AsnC family transcriptional regulator [Rhodospirillales bacterium]|jgi:DNA-binding Lrp family transcriptional regulator|nr:AsnC family transcriptional regulator [Rhodospirillales bacterium]